MQGNLSAVWNKPGDVSLVMKPLEAPEVGGITVKVESCALCGSDLRILRHGNARVTPGRTVGHEISGRVVAIGKGVTRFKEDDRVSIGADVPCGKCAHCLSGRANCCDINYAIGHQFEGGFAQYIPLNKLVVDLGPVHKIAASTSYDIAALAEPLACCINGYERGLMSEGRSVVIFGAGPIGMMLAMLAPMYGASSVTMIDPTPGRLAKARQLGLAQHYIAPSEHNPVEAVMDLTKGIGADMIFTACPAVETHSQAIQMLAKRGVVNLFGGVPKDSPAIALESNFIHYREAYLTGSHGSTPVQHAKAVEFIESGKIDVEKLITHRIPLDKIHDAYQVAGTGDAVKVVVKPYA